MFKARRNSIHVPNFSQKKHNNRGAIFNFTTDSLQLILENYPSVTYKQIAKFISSKQNVFYKHTFANYNTSENFCGKKGQNVGRIGNLKHQELLVLIVNEKTHSNGEFYTLCLQTAANEIIIATKNSGADGKVTRFKTTNNIDKSYSYIEVLYPD